MCVYIHMSIYVYMHIYKCVYMRCTILRTWWLEWSEGQPQRAGAIVIICMYILYLYL